MKSIALGLAIATLVACSEMKLWNNHEKIVDEMQQLTESIATTYFSEARCIGIIAENPGIFLKESELPVFYITINRSKNMFDNLLLTAINEGCLAFVVQVDDVIWMVDKFTSLFRSPASVHRANRRYLYLPQVIGNDQDSRKAVMNEVFITKSMNWMPDLLIVDLVTDKGALDDLNLTKQVENERKGIANYEKVAHNTAFQFEIYTHKFVGENPSTVTLLDIWVPDQGFKYGMDLYSDKVHNLMGKVVKTMSVHYPPFTVVILDGEKPLYSGVEFLVLIEFGKRHNITWENQLDPDSSWGDVWSNGSGNGVIGAMAVDKTDISLTALYMLTKGYPFMDYSIPHYQSCMSAITPKPKMLPAWLIPVRPFNSYMWCAVFASVVIVTLVLYVTSKSSEALLGSEIPSRYSTLLECAFRTAGLLVLQVPEDERDFSSPKYVPMRHLVTWLTVFFVVLTSAYGGGLSFILTVPQFSSPIDTVQELAESRKHWYGPDEAFLLNIYNSTDPALKALLDNFLALPEEELIKTALDDDTIMLVERLEKGSFSALKYISEEAMQIKRLMRENIFCEHLVFAVSKGSPYKANLNALVYKLRQTGILYYWEGMMSREFLSQNLLLAIQQSRSPPVAGNIVLTFEHVQGEFYILGLGLFLALIIFILELGIFYSAEKKKRRLSLVAAKMDN